MKIWHGIIVPLTLLGLLAGQGVFATTAEKAAQLQSEIQEKAGTSIAATYEWAGIDPMCTPINAVVLEGLLQVLITIWIRAPPKRKQTHAHATRRRKMKLMQGGDALKSPALVMEMRQPDSINASNRTVQRCDVFAENPKGEGQQILVECGAISVP